jgi:hypothetical protein
MYRLMNLLFFPEYKASVTSTNGSPETPKASSPASDDDETVIQQLTRSRDRPTPSGPVTRKTRKVELETSEPSEPKLPNQKTSQSKKIKPEHDDLPDPKTQKFSDKSLRSRMNIGKVTFEYITHDQHSFSSTSR